jgi:hypothetical protein
MSAKGGYGGGIPWEVAGMEPRWHGWGHGGGYGKLMGMAMACIHSLVLSI